jgi:hypothetical protein
MERRQRATGKGPKIVESPASNSDEDTDDLDAPRVAQWEDGDEDLEGDEPASNESESEQPQSVGHITFSS